MTSSYRVCSVAECFREHKTRGWCNAHYLRWLRDYSKDFESPISLKGARGTPQKALKDSVTEIDLAWYAGFFDGEGSLGVYKHKRKNGRVNYNAKFTVNQVSPLPIETIKSFYEPDTIRVRKVTKANQPTQRDIYIAELSQRYMIETLSALMPYLTNKAEEAWVTMNFLITRFTKEHPLDHKVFKDYSEDLKRLKVA